MAVTTTTRLNLAKQDEGDVDWEVALNQGFDDADARLLKTGTDVDPSTTLAGDYVGQLFYKIDETPPKVYICTVAGGVGAATWLPFSQLVHGGAVDTAIELSNTIALRGQQVDTTPINLALVDGADQVQLASGASAGVLLGALAGHVKFLTDALANFTVDDGGGPHKILTDNDEGTLDAGTLGGVAAADYVPRAPDYETGLQPLPPQGPATSHAHGLGVYPSIVTGVLECVSPIYGWSVGDRIMTGSSTTLDSNWGVGIWYNATNVGMALATLSLLTKTGGNTAASVANWNYNIRVWK